MTTSTEIANRALAVIAGKATITDLSLEQSNEARYCRLFYDSTRDAMLRAAHWNFAKKTVILSLLKQAPGTPGSTSTETQWDPATMPAPPWLYEYAYPSDCVLLRYVAMAPGTAGGSTSIFPYAEIGTLNGVPQRYFGFSVSSGTATDGQQINVVLTNAQTAIGCYTARIVTEDLWDAAFQEAMVYALASRITMPLTGKREILSDVARQAMSAVLQARARDGNEGLTRVDHTPDWIVARGVWGGDYPTNYVAPWITPSFLAG